MGVDISVYLFDSRPYEDSILPAYRAFVERSDTGPLVRLLQSALPRVESIPTARGGPGWSKAIYEGEIEVLTGHQYYNSLGKTGKKGSVTSPEDMRVFVDGQVAPELVQVLCFPQDMGFNPRQSMSRRALVNYLYSHSQWIEDHFTGSKQVSGAIAEIKIGEWSQFFSEEEISTFDIELSQMPYPTDEQILADGFDNLRLLVHTAATHPNLRLLFVIS